MMVTIGIEMAMESGRFLQRKMKSYGALLIIQQVVKQTKTEEGYSSNHRAVDKYIFLLGRTM